MAQIPLLHPSFEEAAETGNVGAGRLEIGKRVHAVVILEVVVGGETLRGVNRMIKPDGKLVGAVLLVGSGGDDSRAQRSDKIVIEGQGRGIKACDRDFAVGEDGGVGGARLDGGAARRRYRRRASRAGIEGIRDGLVGQSTREGPDCAAGVRPREVAARFGRGGKEDLARGNAFTDAIAFIGAEDEGFVFFDGAAESGAKLILLVIGNDGIEEAFGVEDFIAEEFVEVAVNLIGSGFGDDVDDRARVAAVFRVEGIGEDTKFVDGIGRRLDGRGVHKDVVSIAAIHHVIVGAASAAVHGNDARIVTTVEKIGAELRLHARLQLEELVGIAGIERELADGTIRHDGAELRGGGVNHGRSSGDFDALRGRAKLQGDIDIEDLIEVQNDAFVDVFLEALLVDVDFVAADGDLDEAVVAVFSGEDLPGRARSFIDELHGGGGDGSAARVGNGSADAAAGALRVRAGKREHRHGEDGQRNQQCVGRPGPLIGLHDSPLAPAIFAIADLGGCCAPQTLL